MSDHRTLAALIDGPKQFHALRGVLHHFRLLVKLGVPMNGDVLGKLTSATLWWPGSGLDGGYVY